MKTAVGRFVGVARAGLGLALVVAALSGAALAVPPAAPEIDPGSLGSALTLLTGGALLLAGKSRKS